MRGYLLVSIAVALLWNGITEAMETQAPPDEEHRLWDGKIEDDPAPREGFSPTYSAEASLLFSGISGFVQTPKGGRIGSTSLNRPTLGELNIRTAVTCDSKVAVGLDDDRLYLGARTQQFSGSSVLEEELKTKNEIFPADLAVESYVGLDCYRFGAQHTFEVAGSPDLTLSPSAEILLFDFGYQIAAEDGPFIRRRYLTSSYRVGVDLDCTVSGALSVSLEGFATVPLEKTETSVLDVTLGGKYGFVAGRVPMKVRLGVGYTSIDFEDTQPIPNHIHTEIGPALMAGFEASF